MVRLTTSSPICTRIVISFLHFLSFVEGLSSEENLSLKYLEQALKQVFGISDYNTEATRPKVSLLSMFSNSSYNNEEAPSASTSSSSLNNMTASFYGPRTPLKLGSSQLFYDYYERLVEFRFFDFIFGENYKSRRTRAKNIFNAATKVLIESPFGTFSLRLETLAHALQTLGRRAFDMKYYYKSAELYCCAIAMFNENPDYFCERAMALMMIERYKEAMNDCYKALRMKEDSVRAYYTIGCIYMQQGKNDQAISHGFLKALKINPWDKDVLHKLKLAEGKMQQEMDQLNTQKHMMPDLNTKQEIMDLNTKQEIMDLNTKQEIVDGIEFDEAEDDSSEIIADFMDIFAQYSFPPQSEADALFI